MAETRTVVTESYPRGNRSAAGESVPGLSIPDHDHIEMEYNGTDLVGVKYFSMAAEPIGKELRAQLELKYDASGNLTSVTKLDI